MISKNVRYLVIALTLFVELPRHNPHPHRQFSVLRLRDLFGNAA